MRYVRPGFPHLNYKRLKSPIPLNESELLILDLFKKVPVTVLKWLFIVSVIISDAVLMFQDLTTMLNLLK